VDGSQVSGIVKHALPKPVRQFTQPKMHRETRSIVDRVDPFGYTQDSRVCGDTDLGRGAQAEWWQPQPRERHEAGRELMAARRPAQKMAMGDFARGDAKAGLQPRDIRIERPEAVENGDSGHTVCAMDI
jgi:hypothetical protein